MWRSHCHHIIAIESNGPASAPASRGLYRAAIVVRTSKSAPGASPARWPERAGQEFRTAKAGAVAFTPSRGV